GRWIRPSTGNCRFPRLAPLTRRAENTRTDDWDHGHRTRGGCTRSCGADPSADAFDDSTGWQLARGIELLDGRAAGRAVRPCVAGRSRASELGGTRSLHLEQGACVRSVVRGPRREWLL